LFITTCIEKQYTRPLSSQFLTLSAFQNKATLGNVQTSSDGFEQL